MDRGEQRAVQPATTLGDKLGYSRRNVGCGFGALHILEADNKEAVFSRIKRGEHDSRPPFVLLGHNLKAKDTILGQVHVPLCE